MLNYSTHSVEGGKPLRPLHPTVHPSSFDLAMLLRPEPSLTGAFVHQTLRWNPE